MHYVSFLKYIIEEEVKLRDLITVCGDPHGANNQGKQLYLYRRRTNRLDDQFVLDDQFDCINTKTSKSVNILSRRLVRQYKYQTDRIFGRANRRTNRRQNEDDEMTIYFVILLTKPSQSGQKSFLGVLRCPGVKLTAFLDMGGGEADMGHSAGSKIPCPSNSTTTKYHRYINENPKMSP